MKASSVKKALLAIGYLVVVPVVAWLIARSTFNPRAQIVGPFLFVSPAIAYTAGLVTVLQMKWVKAMMKEMNPEQGPPDSEMDGYNSSVAKCRGLAT